MTINHTICHLEKCSLDRAIDLAQRHGSSLWGFSVYDLLFTDGFNAIYQLKKYAKVLADLRLDNEDIDYILQCAWAAGADLVSIKTDSHKFTANIAAYPGCKKIYPFQVVGKQLISAQHSFNIVNIADLSFDAPL